MLFRGGTLESRGVDKAAALDGLQSAVNDHRTNYCWWNSSLSQVPSHADCGRGPLGLHFGPRKKKVESLTDLLDSRAKCTEKWQKEWNGTEGFVRRRAFLLFSLSGLRLFLMQSFNYKNDLRDSCYAKKRTCFTQINFKPLPLQWATKGFHQTQNNFRTQIEKFYLQDIFTSFWETKDLFFLCLFLLFPSYYAQFPKRITREEQLPNIKGQLSSSKAPAKGERQGACNSILAKEKGTTTANTRTQGGLKKKKKKQTSWEANKKKEEQFGRQMKQPLNWSKATAEEDLPPPTAISKKKETSKGRRGMGISTANLRIDDLEQTPLGMVAPLID
ncbi:hypothetical protein CDAR_35461 [Caerostris darwini]|uniref:Uncharacterized protein n=1 Tax=Caerostris darwini TaxID=1538125 RepID=A0AAV4SPA2_9ARAC|nr:hypothetical protein CDAR_35461 [Caerostris darwini]